MIEQIEAPEVELDVEDLEQVQGGARRAGGDQQEYVATGGSSIIAI